MALDLDAGGTEAASTAPLIVHVIHQLDVGGLENGLVNATGTPSSA